MKKFFLLFSLLGIAASSNAQTPIKKSLSLVHKITATWCGPCGQWGWNLANDLISQTSGKALYVNLFSSMSTSNGNGDFYNVTAATLANQFTLIGYPDFGANALTLTEPNYDPVAGTINTAGVKSDILAAVNAFATTEAAASAASIMTISGNTVTVNAKVQFWSASSGEYYLAAYIIEEGAMNIQAGQNGTVAHHGVLRTSMSTALPWGEQIANGAIPLNQNYSKTFTFTVTDTKWDKTKFKIYNVIWKKEGSIYKFVNVSENSAATSVNDVINNASLFVYPNPVNDLLNIDVDALSAEEVTFNVTNIAGQQVVKNVVTKLNAGKNHQSINTASLAPGIYVLNLGTKNGDIQTKFVKK